MRFRTLNALTDIPLVGSRFTWSLGSSSVPYMRKIDRFLSCLDWEILCPKATLFSLHRPCFDHCPLLDSESVDGGSNPSDLERCSLKCNPSQGMVGECVGGRRTRICALVQVEWVKREKIKVWNS